MANRIGSAPNGEKSTLDGTEKFPIDGSKYALVSSIKDYAKAIYDALYSAYEHTHADSDNGGAVAHSVLTGAGTSLHVPTYSSDSTEYLNGLGEWTVPPGSGGITYSSDSTEYLNGKGEFTVPPGTGGISYSSDSTEFLNGKGEWAVPAGGGSATLLRSYWEPLAPPASPTSQDDEFDNGSLDGKWTEFDPNSVLTVTENNTTKGIDLTATSHAAFQLTGIYQTLPAGDFTIWTRVSAMGLNNDYLITGLALWEDPSDTSKALQVAAISPRGSGVTVSMLNYTNYASVGSTRWETSLSPDTSKAFFRIRRNSTDYYWEISSDGIGWFGTGVLNPSFTPTKMGIFIDNSQGITCKSFFPFFRYVASDVGLTGVMNGQRAGIYQT